MAGKLTENVIYMAPMEGLTGYVFRRNYEKHFGRGRVDKYFIPFISPNKTDGYTAREREDILPENNKGVTAVPQIMANNSEYFVRASCMLAEMGYKEVNLNLGCPSGTVVSKFKGAGFLAKPDELDRFLYEVMSSPKMQGIDVSIKTRIGMENPEEFHYLLTIYNQFKFKEIIVHPRVRSDYYKNRPNLAAFEEALEYSENPVCYNGDIFTGADYRAFLERFPKEKYRKMTGVMLGRGFVGNPLIIDKIEECEQTEASGANGVSGGEVTYSNTGNILDSSGSCNVFDSISGNVSGKMVGSSNSKMRIRHFCDDLFTDYLHVLSGDINALHKIKEVWEYLAWSFTGGEKALKRIKKAQRVCDYKAAVDEFFYKAELKSGQ